MAMALLHVRYTELSRLTNEGYDSVNDLNGSVEFIHIWKCSLLHTCTACMEAVVLCSSSRRLGGCVVGPFVWLIGDHIKQSELFTEQVQVNRIQWYFAVNCLIVGSDTVFPCILLCTDQ